MSIRLLIIGGVAGGATAAARARRLDERAEIVIFERGGHISFANCGLPYYIGGVIEDRDNLLVTTREAFMKRYRVDVRINTEVLAIHRDSKELEVTDLLTGETSRERYDKLIVSPGAEPMRPPLDGIDLEGIYRLRNIPDSDRIKAMVDSSNPRAAVVVGGGFIGLEMAENLVHRGVQTTVVEMADQVMAPLDPEMAGLIQAHLREQGVMLELGNGVASFRRNGDGLLVATQSGKDIPCDMVILSIGVIPEVKLAKEAGLQLSNRRSIVVDGTMSTSDPDIFAVGDAVQIRDLVTGLPTGVALAGPANKQARIAADNAMGRRSVYKGALGTSIVKVFKLTVAGTGASEKTLASNKIPYIVSYTHSGSHASYYPGASNMAIKLLFSPGDGTILGAQIAGEEGVDKRIDVLATAMQARMTVFDLEELELAYAPPFSSAKDPVNVAGFVASNILKGDVEITHWHDLAGMDKDSSVLLDLRAKEELDTSGAIPGSLNIPIDDLREALKDLDPHKTYIAYCAIGLRGYLAYRILSQNGFRCLNLSGGFRTFSGAEDEMMRKNPDSSLLKS